MQELTANILYLAAVNSGRLVLMLARVRYPFESPPKGPISTTEHIRVVDYSKEPGE